jgi:hypothetical protein
LPYDAEQNTPRGKHQASIEDTRSWRVLTVLCNPQRNCVG